MAGFPLSPAPGMSTASDSCRLRPMAGALVAVLLLGSLRAAVADDEPPVQHNLGKAFACTDYGGNKVCLVDAAGQITWQVPAKRPIDVWVLPNGNVCSRTSKASRK